MYWDNERDVAVFERQCEETHPSDSAMLNGGLSGGPMMGGGEEFCEAVKETHYVIRSVVDNSGIHEGPFGFVVRDDASAVGDTVHMDDVEKVPAWVDEIVGLGRSAIDSQDIDILLANPVGAEFSMPLATSDGEYTVTFTKVDENVVE
jgi:hypothetical protein